MYLLVFGLITFSACLKKAERDPSTFYYPAEWEPQESVYIGSLNEQFFKLSLDIAKEVKQEAGVSFLFKNEEEVQLFKEYLIENGQRPEDYEFIILPVMSTIAPRDIGPVALVNGLGEQKVVDFKWAGQEGYFDFLVNVGIEENDAREYAGRLDKDQKADSLLGAMKGRDVIESWLAMDGGAIEVNGKGSIILNEYWMLRYNKGADKESIAKELNRTLGVSNFIWIGKGLVEDPPVVQTIMPYYFGSGTDGHTDEYVRFANENTILLAWVDEKEKNKDFIHEENFRRMSYNYELLKNAKDQNGNRFNIIKVPLPDLIIRPIEVVEGWNNDESTMGISWFPKSDGYKVGDTLQQISASSYLNFLMSNNKVLLPTYLHVGGSKEKEEEVKRIFSKLYPEKELVWIDPMVYNWMGGGIHCYTKQVPKIK